MTLGFRVLWCVHGKKKVGFCSCLCEMSRWDLIFLLLDPCPWISVLSHGCFSVSLCASSSLGRNRHSVTCLSSGLNYSREHPSSCSFQGSSISTSSACVPLTQLLPCAGDQWSRVGEHCFPDSLLLPQFSFQHQALEISALKNLCRVQLSMGNHKL